MGPNSLPLGYVDSLRSVSGVLNMSNQNVVLDRAKRRGLAIGVLLGAFFGVATSLVFLLLIIGPTLGLAAGITGLREGPAGRSRAATGGGLLIGMGVVYLCGALNTMNSCQGQEVCGGDSALPLLGLALVILTLGVVVVAISRPAAASSTAPAMPPVGDLSND